MLSDFGFNFSYIRMPPKVVEQKHEELYVRWWMRGTKKKGIYITVSMKW